MNKMLLGFLLLITTSAAAQDLFFQTRVEQGTLSALVDKTSYSKTLLLATPC